MDKRYLSPLEMLNIAIQHAACAEHLLLQKGEITTTKRGAIDALLPVTTLLYKAFQLTLKAYALQEHRPVKQYKTLRELLELNLHLGFSQQETKLIKTLSMQQVFGKGLEYDLWENQQQFHAFCAQLLDLYERLLKMMPLELQMDYQ